MWVNYFPDPILFTTPQRHLPAIDLGQVSSKKTMTTVAQTAKGNKTKHHTPRYAIGMIEYRQQDVGCGNKSVIQRAPVNQLHNGALSSLGGFGFLPIVLLISC
jgi:hypothetical protein